MPSPRWHDTRTALRSLINVSLTDQTNPQPDRVFAVIDAMDAREFGELLADDARLIFGNAEPMIGRGDITAGVSEFYTTIAGLRHVLVNTWTAQAYTIAQLDVTY
jgi:hypothetical protein